MSSFYLSLVFFTVLLNISLPTSVIAQHTYQDQIPFQAARFGTNKTQNMAHHSHGQECDGFRTVAYFVNWVSWICDHVFTNTSMLRTCNPAKHSKAKPWPRADIMLGDLCQKPQSSGPSSREADTHPLFICERQTWLRRSLPDRFLVRPGEALSHRLMERHGQ